MERKPGFYKVKDANGWSVAEWTGVYWWTTGENVNKEDSDFEVINETPICVDEEETAISVVTVESFSEFGKKVKETLQDTPFVLASIIGKQLVVASNQDQPDARRLFAAALR